MQTILGTRLVGLYLYGSLVTGDFDYDISDIDLLAATATDIDAREFVDLNQIQDEIAGQYPAWAGRLEIAYVSIYALKTFKSQISQIAIVSPGEPFHRKEAGIDWLINWYMIREKGATLFGLASTELIAPISKAEFMQAVQAQTREWREWIYHYEHQRKGQGYAILTMCRALHAYRQGEQVSKQRAAAWAAQELPEWSALIQNALVWRGTPQAEDEKVDQDATFPETLRFVHFVIEQMG
ncbi:MAG: DUF4111 domain-containing protein [Chloroflexi bacterium]|nr:DUF4111 domain-containing protein [Chloroflexota bacterium]